MSLLPKIDLPTYEVTIPSTGKQIVVRPFKVKEEKLLLMATESGDQIEIVNTTKQIINNCILTEGVSVDTLPFFDVDYLIIFLRAKSIGESIELEFTCNAVIDGMKCGHVYSGELDLSTCRIVKDETISNLIDIGSGVQIKMKYPNYGIMKVMNENDHILDRKIKVIANCIDMIIKGDEVHTTKDRTIIELVDYVENLSEFQYTKLERFIDNFPSFVVDIETSCSSCGTVHKKEYRDFSTFFQ